MPEKKTKKPSSFSVAMQASQEPAAGAVTAVQDPPPAVANKSHDQKPLTGSKPRTRRGTRQVGGHFDPAVLRQVKQIGLDHDLTVQEIVAEALDMVFQKYGKLPIASRQSDNTAS